MAVHPASERDRSRPGTMPARPRCDGARCGPRWEPSAAYRGRGHQRQGLLRRLSRIGVDRGRVAYRSLYITASVPLQRTGEDRRAGGIGCGARRGVRTGRCGPRRCVAHVLRVRDPCRGGHHRTGAGRRGGHGGRSRRPAGRGQRVRAGRLVDHRDRRRSPCMARRRSRIGGPREGRNHARGRALRHRRALAAGERRRPRPRNRYAVSNPGT